MKFLCVGDPHIKADNISLVPELTNKIRNATELVGAGTIIVFMGDIFHSHEKVHVPSLNAALTMYETLSKTNQIITLVGNHDFINNKMFCTKDHSLNVFNSFSTIVDTPMVLDGCLFIPFVPISEIEKVLQPAKCVFAHQEFKGATYGSGRVSEHGSPIPPMPVISGHIHIPQKLGTVEYVGVPWQTQFDEEFDKSFVVVDSDTLSISRIPIKWDHEWRTYRINVSDAKNFTLPDNYRSRVILAGTTGDIAAFKKTSKYKELVVKAKIIPEPNDNISCIAGASRTKTFLDFLSEMCEDQDQDTRDTLREVLNEINA